jgi:hypothetical protein
MKDTTNHFQLTGEKYKTSIHVSRNKAGKVIKKTGAGFAQP